MSGAFAGTHVLRQERKEGSPEIASLSWVLRLPVSPLYTGHPVFLSLLFLSFVSSKTEDWGYLNEDGELGLAYQGLKQVARSNACLSSCVCFVLPACACACFSAGQHGCEGAGHNSRVCVRQPSPAGEVRKLLV